MRNPFTLQLATNEDFCNRTKEISDLLNYAKNGQNVVLLSPRRMGKSSLTLRVLKELKQEGYLTVYIDLLPVSSEKEFITKLATNIAKEIGRDVSDKTMRQRFEGLFKKLTPVLEIKPDGTSLSIKFDPDAKVNVLLEDLLNGVSIFLKKRKIKACFVFDEFQEITELPESKNIEGTLRSYIQSEKEISFFFVGSRRRILQDMFTNAKRPFYKSAFIYELKRISEEDFVSYIMKKFNESGKECNKAAASKIYNIAEGFPYYVQKLSLIAWDITEKECDIDTVSEAYKILLKDETYGYENILSGLTLIQRSVLRAISLEPTSSVFTTEYLKKYSISLGGLQKALKALLSKDIVEKDEEGIYKVVDPVFRSWFIETG